jgi:hypothetical protein
MACSLRTSPPPPRGVLESINVFLPIVGGRAENPGCDDIEPHDREGGSHTTTIGPM